MIFIVMNLSQNHNDQSFGKKLIPHILEITRFFEANGVLVKPYPKLVFSKDKEYVNDVFGKTAWYTPEDRTITLITEGRHPKDVLRSYTHELVHHNQNLEGKLSAAEMASLSDPSYAKNNEILRKLEEDAYLRGNMLFRDWTDSVKNK